MLKVGEFEKPRTKLLFYIVKYGPNNTKVVKLMTNKPSPGGKVGPKHDRMSCNSILLRFSPVFRSVVVRVAGARWGQSLGHRRGRSLTTVPVRSLRWSSQSSQCLRNLHLLQAVSGEQQSSPSPGPATFYSGSLPQEPFRCRHTVAISPTINGHRSFLNTFQDKYEDQESDN